MAEEGAKNRHAWLDLAFFVAVALTLATGSLQLALIRGYPARRNPNGTIDIEHGIRAFPPGWFRLPLTIACALCLCMALGLAAIRRTAVGSKQPTGLLAFVTPCWREAQRPAAPLVRLTGWELGTAVVYLLGIFAGAGIRAGLPLLDVKDFAIGAAPIVAALLIGVLVTLESKLPWQRQLALTFLLLSVLATGFGTIGAVGWPFGLCFVLVVAGLFDSALLMLQIIVERGQRT